MSFFFIRPYSSRGIGIWSYVTELHIKRAKRVVKKAECFFQIENLRSLFNLWLTDIFVLKKGSWCNRQQLGCQAIKLQNAVNCSFAYKWWIWMHIQIHDCIVQKIVWNTQWGCIFFTLTCTPKLWVIVWYV